MAQEHIDRSGPNRSPLRLSGTDNRYRENIYCHKPDPKTEEHLPYHCRTRPCDEQSAYRARDRYMNSDQKPIEPGSPYISKDPVTGKTIVIYKDLSISDEAIYEEYNWDKGYIASAIDDFEADFNRPIPGYDNESQFINNGFNFL